MCDKTEEEKVTVEEQQFPEVKEPHQFPAQDEELATRQEEEPVLLGFEVSMEGIGELENCINSIVQNKYVRLTLASCVNEIMKPKY